MRKTHDISLICASAMAAILAGGSAWAAPAVYVEPQPGLSAAATQPLRDVGLMRTKVEPSLQRAHADPYGLQAEVSCDAIRDEIRQLDLALGPDVDSPKPKRGVTRGMIRGLATDAVGGLVKIPFRGVVRHISGAEARDRDRQEATVAGMARRAYLKGVAHGQCRSEGPLLQVAAMPPQQGAEPTPATEPARPATYVWLASDDSAPGSR